MKAFLILEDGTVFTGQSIGAPREVISEIVFNTSMTGYLEVLTDPSYAVETVMAQRRNEMVLKKRAYKGVLKRYTEMADSAMKGAGY